MRAPPKDSSLKNQLIQLHYLNCSVGGESKLGVRRSGREREQKPRSRKAENAQGEFVTRCKVEARVEAKARECKGERVVYAWLRPGDRDYIRERHGRGE